MYDESSFAALYTKCAPVVFRRARQLLQQEADAHEVVQDVFLSLYENPEQHKGQSAIMTFLYSVTTHACLNRIRNSKNRERLQREYIHFEDSSAGTQRLSPEQTSMLWRALQVLPDDVCQAIIYYAVDGMTHNEIAGIMTCSRRHVGDLLASAVDWLQRHERPPC